DSLLEHYNLPNSFYSFNYKNVHILVLDTQLEFSLNVFKPEKNEEEEDNTDREKDKESNNPDRKYYTTTLEYLLDQRNVTAPEIPPFHLIDEEMIVENVPLNTEQYNFIVNDLKIASNNSSIDWIIVILHKPIYSSLSSNIQEYIIREKYQHVFDRYGVDLVLQGHNHIYDRTLPLRFNPNDISNPIVDDSSNNTSKFVDPQGTIFSVIGLGGRSSHIMLNQPEFVVKQSNDFGFLTIEITGNDLNAKYYDIGFNCDKEQLEESDLEEGDFIIFNMSSCKNNKIDESIEIVDHYTLSK
ncbi:MAG: metallophosphoesterase, partial [Nitrososphaeraceae archaeon]|nr:metallophosphoesterase [Nitrososphaeraceae archaeon]